MVVLNHRPDCARAFETTDSGDQERSALAATSRIEAGSTLPFANGNNSMGHVTARRRPPSAETETKSNMRTNLLRLGLYYTQREQLLLV